jgi:C2 domain
MNYFKNIKKDQEAKEEEDKKAAEDDEEEEKKGEEKEEEKKAESSQGDQKKGRNVPPLISFFSKKRPQMTRERWMEMAQIRRWNVRITNITIENLYKEPYDPFIEFVIGGNFRILEKKGKKGKVENVYVGNLGYTKKTEVLENIEDKELRLYDTRIRCEYNGSYFDIQEESLRIDVWDYQKWTLNEFLGRVEVPLIEIIQGDVDQSFVFMKAGEKKKIKLCRLNFTISFQEIWDFVLNFSDWSVNGIITEHENAAHPSLEFSLASQGFLRSKIRTKVIENENNPQWPTVPGSLAFRGTVNELENQKLAICLYEGRLLSSRLVGVKISDLTGIVDSGVISTDMIQQLKHRGAHKCSIKGRVNILKTPRYRQTGEIIMLNSEGQYLCVSVLRVDNVILSNDKGVVNTYIELEWGGYLKRTKTAFRSYKPIFNDTFYFPINISEGLLGNNEHERNKSIMKELLLYNHIKFNLWGIDEQLSNDSLGSAEFFLSELQTGKIQEKEFFDEKTQQAQVMKIRVWSGKKQLTSPFIEAGEISNLFIDVWVLYENEKKLEYEDLPKEIEEKLPADFDKCSSNWKINAKNISDAFPEETQRLFFYMMKDENDKERFLPMFISKLGYPNPSKSIKNNLDDEVPINYLSVNTIAEHSYYCSLIPFSIQSNNIWCSPHFLIHMKKGEIEDHAILAASLFMSIVKEAKDDSEDEIHDDETIEETSRLPKSKLKSELESSKKKNDMESKVFLCVGSLKERKTNHVWVMTINKDFKGVTFWEISNCTSFELKNRVQSAENLEKFIKKEPVNVNILKVHKEESSVKNEKISEESEEEHSESMEENEENDRPADRAKKINEFLIKKEDLAYSKFNPKSPVHREDPPKNEKKNFLSSKIEEEKKDVSNFASLVQEPRLLPGSNEVDLPYRSIEFIFNNKNIFMNLQHFDPARILYDIYDNTLWHPFIESNFKPLGAFYPPPILSPPLLPPLAKKLYASILKEMKMGISALRSGKNLGTSWKNQKDQCIQLMEDHLLFLEKISRGEIDEKNAKAGKREWGLKMRQFMPKSYRISAIPGHFNYPEPDRIAQLFIDQAKDFFTMQSKKVKWAVAVRLFPYVSKVISIRILVAAFYPVPGGEDI